GPGKTPPRRERGEKAGGTKNRRTKDPAEKAARGADGDRHADALQEPARLRRVTVPQGVDQSQRQGDDHAQEQGLDRVPHDVVLDAGHAPHCPADVRGTAPAHRTVVDEQAQRHEKSQSLRKRPLPPAPSPRRRGGAEGNGGVVLSSPPNRGVGAVFLPLSAPGRGLGGGVCGSFQSPNRPLRVIFTLTFCESPALTASSVSSRCSRGERMRHVTGLMRRAAPSGGIGTVCVASPSTSSKPSGRISLIV